MQSFLRIVFGATLLAIASGPALAGSDIQDALHVAQNTGAADRGLGNGAMGIGDGVERLPEQRDEDRDLRDEQAAKTYDQSGHGDTQPDMQHRPRRTLGDRDDD